MDRSLELLLFRCIRSDDNLEEVRELLARGADPNYQISSGYTLLQRAAIRYENCTRVVQELIKSGADVNLCNHLDYTALHIAVKHQNFHVVDELLQSGAFVNAKTFLKMTPLHFAVSRRLNCFPPDSRIIEKLLQHEDIEYNSVDFYGNTPLMLAVKKNHIEAVNLLLNIGVNPDIPNNMFETPLHVAFAKKFNYIAFKLLLNGASICVVNGKGETPLDMLFENMKCESTSRLAQILLKFLAVKYHITDDLKKKLESFPVLSQFMKRWCREVSCMRTDFITDKITVHDFVWNCFAVPRKPQYFEELVLGIHKPLIYRLMMDLYPEYFGLLLSRVSNLNLCSVLEIVVDTRKKSKWCNHPNLFSNVDIIYLLSRYLLRLDIFCLIVALSNVEIPESMRNIREREICYPEA